MKRPLITSAPFARVTEINQNLTTPRVAGLPSAERIVIVVNSHRHEQASNRDKKTLPRIDAM